MNQSPFRSWILGRIEQAGRRLGAPTAKFADKSIAVAGESLDVKQTLFRSIVGTNGFYLSLPADTFGVVIFPDGTSQNMAGGLHEVPAGFYKIQYVDRHERLEFLSPVSEMSTDGEKITLKVVLRYRVIDPIVALRIDRPIETLIEHVEADVAQYIRTHAHTDIADSPDQGQYSRLLSFFTQRHNRRLPLSGAFSITGIELKDFTGDDEYVEMRRREGTDAMRNRIEKQQIDYQQQLTLTKAQFKAEGEKAMLDHKAALDRKTAEQKVQIEQLEARHEKQMQAILNEVHLREIELDNKRRQLQARRDEFSHLMETIAPHFASGNPANPAVLKTFAELLVAYKEELDNEAQTPMSSSNHDSSKEEHRSSTNGSRTSSSKVENLKNTLLDLLNPKK